MKIEEVRYERTFNLGNYQSEKIGVTVSFAPDEEAPTLEEAVEALREDVKTASLFSQRKKKANKANADLDI